MQTGKLKKFPVVGCDAGGTLTDIFLLDDDGNYYIGKAPTTPHDESIGFWESMEDAFKQCGYNLEQDPEALLSDMNVAVYSGTTMLNTLLSKKGRKTGLIVTAGFEDTMIQERGAQCWSGYSYTDKWHKAVHQHNEPLIPRKLIRGVTERVDLFGRVVIPLYEEEVKAALRYLVKEKVEAIGVCFLWSFMNREHEDKILELAAAVFEEMNVDIPVYLSSRIAPIMMEHSRMNCTAIQAAASETVRAHLFNIEAKLKNGGYKSDLHITTAGGGIVNIRYPKLVESVVSGPIGGLMGAKYLGEAVGLGESIVCTDLGGTSFDVGIITGGLPFTDREIHVARFILNLPILTMHNIGAGLGSLLRVSDKKEIFLGPDSVGSDPGPVAYDRGNDIPTLTDAHAILGHLNPDYFLGGRIKLNLEKAREAFEEKVAKPLGLDVYEAAEGAIKVCNVKLREAVLSTLRSRGLHPADYYLLSYGGAGPVEVCYYSDDLPFKGILTVPFAAAFSSFGLLTDYAHKYQKSTLMSLPAEATEETKMMVGSMLNSAWEDLEQEARHEMEEVGITWDNVDVQPIVYFRYGFQLTDVETPSPIKRINSAADMDLVINTFEEIYSKAYTNVAKHPEAGYTIMNVGLVASMPLVKPQLKKYELVGPTPPQQAYKGKRKMYFNGEWSEVDTWEMDELLPGNELNGNAVIEAANTTLIVPAGKKASVDEWKLFWINNL